IGVKLPTTGIRQLLHVRHKSGDIQELWYRSEFLCLLVDHQRGSDSAVRVATATDLTPIGSRAVDEIGKIRERSHQRQREPIASRFRDTDLAANIIRQVR